MSNFTLRSQIVHGAKLSAVPNCPRCQIVHFWPAVPNCPRCQIVHFTLRCQIVLVPNCPLLHCGAKLSANMGGAKLSTVPNCPRCQIVLGPETSDCPIPCTTISTDTKLSNTIADQQGFALEFQQIVQVSNGFVHPQWKFVKNVKNMKCRWQQRGWWHRF